VYYELVDWICFITERQIDKAVATEHGALGHRRSAGGKDRRQGEHRAAIILTVTLSAPLQLRAVETGPDHESGSLRTPFTSPCSTVVTGRRDIPCSHALPERNTSTCSRQNLIDSTNAAQGRRARDAPRDWTAMRLRSAESSRANTSTRKYGARRAFILLCPCIALRRLSLLSRSSPPSSYPRNRGNRRRRPRPANSARH